MKLECVMRVRVVRRRTATPPLVTTVSSWRCGKAVAILLTQCTSAGRSARTGSQLPASPPRPR